MSPANPGVAIQTAWLTGAGTVYCAAPPPRVPCLIGPEDGTGGARRDACTTLHGPSDDIRVGRHWTNQLPNPREAWGQTLQLRQRTQADDRGRRISCHRTPCTLWRPGAPATRHSVPHPPRVASYLVLFICFLNPTDIKKGPPSTTIGGRRASQESFWGGYLRQTLRTMHKRRIYLPE